jgi:hypothetical protein
MMGGRPQAAASGGTAAWLGCRCRKIIVTVVQVMRRRDFGAASPSLGATDWLELLVSSSWSGATGLAMVDKLWAAAPGGAALILLACLRPRGKR